MWGDLLQGPGGQRVDTGDKAGFLLIYHLMFSDDCLVFQKLNIIQYILILLYYLGLFSIILIQ